ncbi:hypothetical protein C8R47DRAFT_999342 [Mycena vitilis]|nr:hypothetical protein C8R47DRAFT_999342 [Mycena vitilis]
MTGDDVFISSGLVAHGMIPSAPWAPKVVIATRLLELYRLARLRCPTLGIQAWMKTLADLHGDAFKPYSVQEFSTCFDVYLDILKVVDERVDKVLGRDAPNWRLKNCCPACTYKLEGEAKMIFEMLMAMDGNNSLKRVLTKERGVDEDGVPKRGGTERPDPRTEGSGGSYFMTRSKVDEWSKEVLAQQRSEDPEEDNECQERWKNMSEELTERMWGIFDETGIFLALCRHGFVLLVADMVRSGELSKYGLAITNALLDAFGPDLGLGYDIGCGFGTTIRESPLGPKAKRERLKTLVGAFHGHAHNRMCQLKYLVTYVPGLGLEDLEGCERFFSKSNALSRSTRYASIFHRRQAIATYLAHVDTFETYGNLSTFLVNNYKQALDLIDLNESLQYAMDQAGITGPDVFVERLKQEMEYLKNLSKEPDEETDQMEYYQRLVNLEDRTYVDCIHVDSKHLMICFSTNSKANGTTKRHARENYDKAVAQVQEMEDKLEPTERWTGDSKEWQEAAELVSTRRYRLAVNRLEELVVKRLFELTKMNMSGTGYKLRRHIAKALQTRSRTIRTALARYNDAAVALDPPRRVLSWNDVVEYTFLADFDILRDPEANTVIRPWATPAARELMDTYFKIERAKEEVQRLDIEIRRFVTYMKDEREFLEAKEKEVEETEPHLAFFVRRYRMRHGRFEKIHMDRFKKMAAALGTRFTGTLVPGVRLATPVMAATEGDNDDMDIMEENRSTDELAWLGDDGDDGWETEDSDFEEEGADQEAETLAEALETVLVLATDKEDVPEQ